MGDTSEIVKIFVAIEGGPLGLFNIHSVAKHQKIEGEKFLFPGKISQCRKKTENGDLLGQKFPKKVSQAEKFERGDPLVSPRMVCYAGKQEKPFWFSLLGQMVQFGAIIFCRTLKNYFGQFVWIEKKESL